MNINPDIWNNFIKQTKFTAPIQKIVERLIFLRNSQNNWFFELGHEWKFLANDSDKLLQFYKILTLHFGNTRALHLFVQVDKHNNLYKHVMIHRDRITTDQIAKKPFNFIRIIKYIKFLDSGYGMTTKKR